MKQNVYNRDRNVLEKGMPMKQTQLNQTIKLEKGMLMERVDFNWTIKLEKGDDDMNWEIKNISETRMQVRNMPVDKVIASAFTDLTNDGDERKIFLQKPDGDTVAVAPIEWGKRITCGHCGEVKYSNYNNVVIDGKDICPQCFYKTPSPTDGKWKTQAVVQPHRKPIVRYSSTPEGTLKDVKAIVEKGLELGLWLEPKIFPPNSDKPVSIYD